MSDETFVIVNIDDNDMNLLLIESYLARVDAKFVNFADSTHAVEYIRNNPCDLVIVDYQMPVMNGIEATHAIKAVDPEIPIIMITASSAEDAVQIKALQAGVNDFIIKPINRTILLNRVQNFMKLRKAIKRLIHHEKSLQEEVQEATYESLRVLSRAAEYKDEETANHVKRVSSYSVMIARYLGLSDAEQEILRFAAPLHDLGKVGTPDHILLKPGKLDDHEMEIMRKHAHIGADILENALSPYLKAGHIIALSHHEKYDGTGYPQGLKGEEIPLYGRIVAIADVFDALTSNRPYKKAWSFEEAVGFLHTNSGKHFDPVLVNLFTDHLDEVRTIFETYTD